MIPLFQTDTDPFRITEISAITEKGFRKGLTCSSLNRFIRFPDPCIGSQYIDFKAYPIRCKGWYFVPAGHYYYLDPALDTRLEVFSFPWSATTTVLRMFLFSLKYTQNKFIADFHLQPPNMEEDRVEWFRKAINELLQTSIETPTSLDQFFLAKAVQFINMLEDSQVTYNLSYVLNYAKPLGMSDRNMRRMCQQIFHTSPAEVINTHLMQQIATHLVLYPHEQISGVAFGLGFEHESTFNRFMKRRLNLHPSGFRKEFSNAVF